MLRSDGRVFQADVLHGVAEEQHIALQVQPVLGRGEVQGLADLAGAVEKVFLPVGVHRGVPEPQPLHDLRACRRFQRPQQYGGRLSFRFRHEVQAVVHAVDEIDIGMAGAQEQGLRPGRAAVVVGMARLVAPADVGLRLRDAARQQDAVSVPHQVFSQQGLGDGKGVMVEKCVGQPGHKGASFCRNGGKSGKKR